jgi:heat shock protein HslJ
MHSSPRRHRARVAAALGAVLLLALAGCGDDDTATSAGSGNGNSSGSGSSGGSALEGTSWILSTDAPLGVALEAIAVTAQFKDGRLTGNSGCNSYGTTYEVDGDSLTVGPEIESTQMACPPAQMLVEQAYLARLPKVAGFSIDGNELTLTDDQGETILRYEATEGAEAIQGDWTVTGYYSGNAITSVLGGVTLTAKFEDGTVSGSTGCNTFTGTYETDGDNITMGPLATTRAACPTPELTTQESQYLIALGLARTFEVAGNRLDLFREGDTYAVSYTSS